VDVVSRADWQGSLSNRRHVVAQTETGAIMITPLPGATPTKPGSATKPFPGIDVDIMTRDGKHVEDNQGGYW
jgi:acyl-coenzyme A synthetase/AMP-(fatty) acid ligase